MSVLLQLRILQVFGAQLTFHLSEVHLDCRSQIS